jgi:hypothetical protein
MQLREKVNAIDACQCAAAESNGGDGKFLAAEMKVGCYCLGQNCFGNKEGIKCWWCAKLTQEKGGFLLEVELGLEPCLCRFECDMCLCNCQATFNEDKQHTITKSLFKNSMQGEKVSSKFCKSKNKEGCSLFFNFVKSSLHNNSIWEL